MDMGFSQKFNGKLLGSFGSAVKKVGRIGSSAVRIVGDIGNAVAGAYGKVNSITGGALDKTLRTVPGFSTAQTAAGTALSFYNKQIDPRRVAIERTIDTLGTRLQNMNHVKNPG